MGGWRFHGDGPSRWRFHGGGPSGWMGKSFRDCIARNPPGQGAGVAGEELPEGVGETEKTGEGRPARRLLLPRPNSPWHSASAEVRRCQGGASRPQSYHLEQRASVYSTEVAPVLSDRSAATPIRCSTSSRKVERLRESRRETRLLRVAPSRHHRRDHRSRHRYNRCQRREAVRVGRLPSRHDLGGDHEGDPLGGVGTRALRPGGRGGREGETRSGRGSASTRSASRSGRPP